MPNSWSAWMRSAGVGAFTPNEELSLDTYDACVDAAAQGLGMALAVLPIEQALIDAGGLVAPFEQRVPLPQSLYLVNRPGDSERADIRLFRDWLYAQLT